MAEETSSAAEHEAAAPRTHEPRKKIMSLRFLQRLRKPSSRNLSPGTRRAECSQKDEGKSARAWSGRGVRYLQTRRHVRERVCASCRHSLPPGAPVPPYTLGEALGNVTPPPVCPLAPPRLYPRESGGKIIVNKPVVGSRPRARRFLPPCEKVTLSGRGFSLSWTLAMCGSWIEVQVERVRRVGFRKKRCGSPWRV